MNLRAMSFAIGAVLLSGSAALADCHSVQTQSMQTTTLQTTFDAQTPAIVAPVSVSDSQSSYGTKNYSMRNLGNDSGNGTQNFSTIGVDYGIGPNVTGPVGNMGFAIGSGVYNGKLRTHSVGFPPHKQHYMIYDNNVSVGLPSIR